MPQQDNGGAATQMDDYVYPGERFTQSGMRSGHGMGMTMRDWFAGQALSGGYAKWGRFSAKEIATLSYTIADAMLAARMAK